LDAPAGTPQDDSIADLVGRLIDDGREVARAEVNLYKQIALRRSARAKSGLVQLVAAGILAWFAGLALTFGIVLALATLIGPLASGLVLAAAMGAAAWFLLQKGLAGMKALSGDEEERQALDRAESAG
jgi:hypothetical protein